MGPGARVDQGPLQELWGAAEMPPPPGPAAPEAGAALCFTAAPALILPSVEGMVHSEIAPQLFPLQTQCWRENHWEEGVPFDGKVFGRSL